MDLAKDGAQALEKTWPTDYDVVLLDRSLPRLHGDVVCRQLAESRSPSRILMLTAASEVGERVEGLTIGADDYLTKPFACSELLAHIHALSRRVEWPLPPVLHRRDIELDPGRGRASRAGRPLELTRKEMAVLRLLMAADGAIVSAERLLEQAWDENADPFTNTVRVTVSTQRQKLGHPPVIETVIGSGYVIR